VAKVISASGAHSKSKVKRPGIHAKSKSSKLKGSKNYTKL